MRYIKSQELCQAFMRWKEVCPSNKHGEWAYFLNGKVGSLHLNERSVKRIRLILSSPHYKTIIKAMLAQDMESR